MAENKYLKHSVLIILLRQKKRGKQKERKKIGEKNKQTESPKTFKCSYNQCENERYETIKHSSQQTNTQNEYKHKNDGEHKFNRH